MNQTLSQTFRDHYQCVSYLRKKNCVRWMGFPVGLQLVIPWNLDLCSCSWRSHSGKPWLC